MNIGMQAQQSRDQMTRSKEVVGCCRITVGSGGVDLQKLRNVACYVTLSQERFRTMRQEMYAILSDCVISGWEDSFIQWVEKCSSTA